MENHLLVISRTFLVATATFALAACASSGMSNTSNSEQMNSHAELASSATSVIRSQMQEPASKHIPRSLLAKSRCIAVFPSIVKAGFVVGGKRGHGLISCRKDTSSDWTTTVPAYFTLTGGSIGLQAGVQSSRLILLVLNQNGVDQLLSGKVGLGSDIGVVAGPVGANGSLGGKSAPIVAYQKSKGLFAGVDLNGSTLSYDTSANGDVYGSKYGSKNDARDLLFDTGVNQPSAVQSYTQALESFASRQ